MNKSAMFLPGVSDNVSIQLYNILPFVKGAFPVRYLGVPLSPVTLKINEYNGLIKKLLWKF